MRSGVVVCGLILLVGAVLATGTGCESQESREAVAWGPLAEAGDEDAAELFHVDVSLWRRYAGKTWYYDRDDEFKVKRRSYVKARIDVRNVEPGRVYPFHIVWIAPSGHELFRKYAEAVVTPADSVGYVANIDWKKAVDLGYRKHRRREVPEPGFILESSMNISTRREREPGEYLLRVYLDRRLLLERPFTVIGP